jgi:hypothetical protein
MQRLCQSASINFWERPIISSEGTRNHGGPLSRLTEVCSTRIFILASTCFAAALMAIWITGLSWLPEQTPTRFESRLMARPPELVQVETYRSTDKSAL